MRLKLSLLLCSMCLLLGACLPRVVSAPTPDLQTTIVALQVQQTLSAMQISASLTTIAMQPTATPIPTSTSTTAPTPLPTETSTNTPTATPVPLGSISGKLSFPSEAIPPLRVVAFNLTNGSYYYLHTELNTQTYTLADLPGGKYYVLAYLRSNSTGGPPPSNFYAGYSAAVPCRLLATCLDHSLLVVQLADGENKKNIDPTDWYADPIAEGWPKDPLR